MKGYRTIIFNVLTMAVPVLSLTEWMAVIPAQHTAYWLLFVAVANVLLRLITSTPVGEKE